jgi:hypothetical protein
MTTLDNEFIENMGQEFSIYNIAIIKNVSEVTKLIETNFPTEYSRVQWSAVNYKTSSEIKAISAFYGLDSDKVCQAFFGEQITANNLEGNMYFMNDSLNISLYGSVSSFEKILNQLLWPHGHIYLVDAQGLWCLNITFEDDLYFGFRNI